MDCGAGDRVQRRRGDRTQLTALVEKRLKVLDFVAQRLRDSKFTRSYPDGEVDLLNASLKEARRSYLARLR